MNARPRGFTLIEVLVALLILAVAMTAWQLRISGQLDNLAYLRSKLLAGWVAQNQLSYAVLADRFAATQPQASSPAVTQTGEMLLAGQRWYWQLAPSALMPATAATGANSVEQQVMPIEIRVSATSAAVQNNPAAILTGVLHAPVQPAE